MLSSGLVFHNFLPPLVLLLKALKDEKFPREAAPFWSAFFFLIIVIYFLILLNHLPLHEISLHSRVSSTLCKPPPSPCAPAVACSEADAIERSDTMHIPTSTWGQPSAGSQTRSSLTCLKARGHNLCN